jgi:ribosomal protein L28
MPRSCAVCGKISMDGFNAQSSGMNKVRAHRRFRPNLQQTTIQVKGQSVKTLMCTRCQRTLSRADQ